MDGLFFSFVSHFPPFDIQSKVCESVILFKVDLKYLNIGDTFSIALPFAAGLNQKWEGDSYGMDNAAFSWWEIKPDGSQ
ncbi:hypothetical protein IOC57_14175 [Bacillus sp. SD075]|uniref:hypothetical protein n=1 Tax=Bacillus sp. SD075 TaxID=2781732 RepID=UPI001A95C1AA|nr:hypothetical protein [Bacillus sp. SD075]MBO0998881.1 hypothetical protein [Bacillus sp. SD075]